MFPASTGNSAAAQALFFSLFGIDRESSSGDFTFPDVRRVVGGWEQPGGRGGGWEGHIYQYNWLLFLVAKNR